MISLIERSHIPAGPEQVWAFFGAMENHYAEWHREHLSWRWLRGQPLSAGAVWFADEWFGPLRVANRFLVEEADQPHLLTYRLAFPRSLIRAGGSFRFSPAGRGCDYEQEIHLGFDVPIIGRLFDQFLHMLLPIEEFRRHMREEQANLAAMLAERQVDRRQRELRGSADDLDGKDRPCSSGIN